MNQCSICKTETDGIYGNYFPICISCYTSGKLSEWLHSIYDNDQAEHFAWKQAEEHHRHTLKINADPNLIMPCNICHNKESTMFSSVWTNENHDGMIIFYYCDDCAPDNSDKIQYGDSM